MTAPVDIVNFGCRLNMVESEAMRRSAIAAGHEDMVIVNTCAVTGEAARQSRQAIRRLGRERPGARIVATGCAVQIEPQRYAAMPEVAHVIGNEGKAAAATWRDLRERVRVGDIMATRESAAPFRDGLEGRTRGFLQVQNGCDHRCSFCIIPFGRGPSRSSAAAEVVAQARKLVEGGAREIVLTGVDLTSWGGDLFGAPRLGALVREILREVPELARLRLSSLDCIEADAGLLAAIADEPRLMPHLHLSLQSGDDIILKRMKRRHSRAGAVAFCKEVRRLRPDMALGADIIAGFPTETEAMFERSLALVADCALTTLHVFPYSPRPGTPAGRMPPVDGVAVKERAARLRALGEAAHAAHLARQVGRRLAVLMERGGIGRAEDFSKVRLDAAAGALVKIQIAGVEDAALVANAPP